MTDCPFCANTNEKILESDSAFSVYDNFPVTKLHALVMPRRHIGSFFELTPQEYQECVILLHKVREKILSLDAQITGFNMGINDGPDAGQTIPHCHIHLIPRRKGDVENPRGGIRHVIAGKGDYDSFHIK